MITHYVSQAEWKVVRDGEAVLTTVLGSCIACCLWDPMAKVGGMNHFLLPGEGSSTLATLSAGTASMERLINEVLKGGAERERLRARLFGGAAVVRKLSDIGARNAEFATSYLAAEGIPVIGSSLGGTKARRIRFWPLTGVAQQRLVDDTPVETPPPRPLRGAGALELF